VPSNFSSKSRKERAARVIVPLLLFQLVLLSVQIQNPDGMIPVRTLLLALQAPIVNVSTSILSGIGDLWKNYVWLTNAQTENERLSEEVRQLKMLNRSSEEIRQENIRLRRLLSMKDSIGYRTVVAQVIARTPGFLSNVLYINRGTDDGIQIDSPVLFEDVIIGRTVLVTGGQSQVQLITNSDASLGVMLEQTRTPGVLSGTGESVLDLNYISNAEEIHTGDRVLSSGLDGIFPRVWWPVKWSACKRAA